MTQNYRKLLWTCSAASFRVLQLSIYILESGFQVSCLSWCCGHSFWKFYNMDKSSYKWLVFVRQSNTTHTQQQHNTHKHLTAPRVRARPTMGIHGTHFKNKVRWEASYLSFYKTMAWGRTMETLGESVNLMIFPHWTSSDCLDLDKLPTPLHNGTRQLLYPAGL